jgi:hypothetical protein
MNELKLYDNIRLGVPFTILGYKRGEDYFLIGGSKSGSPTFHLNTYTSALEDYGLEDKDLIAAGWAVRTLTNIIIEEDSISKDKQKCFNLELFLEFQQEFSKVKYDTICKYRDLSSLNEKVL